MNQVEMDLCSEDDWKSCLLRLKFTIKIYKDEIYISKREKDEREMPFILRLSRKMVTWKEVIIFAPMVKDWG
jgi:hypothetical protein